MIFVCVGSRDYQFNRLLKALDKLVENEKIKDEIFAQIGNSSYIPKYYKYEKYISPVLFEEYQKKADIIVSHGGTGALVGALKKGKNVIAVPRLSKYGEHIDDHQTQISEVLTKKGYLRQVLDMNELEQTIMKCKEAPLKKKFDMPSNILNILNDYIENM